MAGVVALDDGGGGGRDVRSGAVVLLQAPGDRAGVLLTAVKDRSDGLILLGPQPGNCEVIAAEKLDLHSGDLPELRCPACGKSHASRVNDNLAEIGFRLSNGFDGRACFSRRGGEHANFFITSEEVRPYGENVDTYSNLKFFGAGEVESRDR
ncbi:MAG: hypothetical protein HY905_26880 [Deltaproteobacteria bacterium]|nr:hypothetical protein [Deltaproteobacteria bacterium]